MVTVFSRNPTSNKNEYVTTDWLPVSEEDYYLDVSDELKMKKGFFEERMHMWAQICRNVLGNYVTDL